MRARNSRFWLVLLLFELCQPCPAADPEVKVGGVALTLPGPTSDFAEAGDRLRTTFFEFMVPATNRLVSAWVPTQKVAELNGGKSRGGLELYAMPEVPRQAEYADFTPQSFELVSKSFGPAMGEFDAKSLERWRKR